MKSLQGRTSVNIPTKYVFLGVGALAALMFVLTVRMFYISLGGGGAGGGGDALRGNDMSSIGATPSVSLVFCCFGFLHLLGHTRSPKTTATMRPPLPVLC